MQSNTVEPVHIERLTGGDKMDETKTNETLTRREMTVVEWAEKFKPVANIMREDADLKGYDKNHPEKGILFCCSEHTYNRNEALYIENAAKRSPDRVWSFFSGDGGEEYATNGYFGDANGYFVTSAPWEQGTIYSIHDDRATKEGEEFSGYE
jgi:hypothetical protein